MSVAQAGGGLRPDMMGGFGVGDAQRGISVWLSFGRRCVIYGGTKGLWEASLALRDCNVSVFSICTRSYRISGVYA